MVSATYRIGMRFISSAFKLLEPRLDDDSIDRLNYLYSTSIIFLFAMLVTAKQYAGNPIECFVPAQFTKAMEQYTENYCWVQNTYWVPFQDFIPHRLDDRERRQIGYYQWIPFTLAIAAIMFHLPCSVWRMLNTQSGINMSLIVQVASQDENVDPLVRNHSVAVLTRHIDDALTYQRDYGNRNRSVYLFAVLKLGKFYGAYISAIYIFVKSLYLCNVFLQFVFLNKFLETSEYPIFGGHVLYDLVMGREWRDSGKFPRVTLCDFEIRVLGNVHRHTVQCVLVINMFTEKIFIFLWLWLLTLSIATAFNLFAWILSLSCASCRHSFVQKFLDCHSSQTQRFVHHFLRPDGVLLLQMIASHGGNIICANLTQSLWLQFIKRSGQVNAISRPKSTITEHILEENWKETNVDIDMPSPMQLLPTTTHFV